MLLLAIVLLFIPACQPSETIEKLKDKKDFLIEQTKVFLADFPLINRWIKLYPKPEKLYQEVEEGLGTLKAKGAERFIPEEYMALERSFAEAKRLYQGRLYYQAEKKLKILNKRIKEAEKKLEEVIKTLKGSAYQKYKEKELELTKKLEGLREEERIKVKVYLLWLRTLIEEGRFEEFEKYLAKDPF